MDKQRPISVTITPGTITVSIFVVLAFLLAFYLRDLLLVVLTAVVLASSIESLTQWFVRRHLPRVLAVVLIYLGALLLLVSFFYFFLPPLANEATDFFRELPTYLDTLKISPNDNPLAGSENVSLGNELLQFQNVIKTSTSGVLTAASAIFGGLVSLVLIVVLSFYFAVQEHALDNFLRLVTPMRNQEYILDLWKRAQMKIGRWLQGQLLLSVIVGILVYIGLLILGVPYALLLALVAAVLELIPVFGSILAAIPAVMLSFIDSGATLAVLVIVLYVIVNQLEGNVIYPMVVQKVLGVPPLVVILAIIAGMQLAGFLGVVIAVPVAAAVQEWIRDIQKGRQQLAYPSEEGFVE